MDVTKAVLRLVYHISLPTTPFRCIIQHCGAKSRAAVFRPSRELERPRFWVPSLPPRLKIIFCWPGKIRFVSLSPWHGRPCAAREEELDMKRTWRAASTNPPYWRRPGSVSCNCPGCATRPISRARTDRIVDMVATGAPQPGHHGPLGVP